MVLLKLYVILKTNYAYHNPCKHEVVFYSSYTNVSLILCTVLSFKPWVFVSELSEKGNITHVKYW